MEINESIATFGINVIGERSNNTYMGRFKVKCLLAPTEEISADKLYRDLLGNNSHLAQERVRQLAFALSQLQYRIIESPEFWVNSNIGGGHITDENVILDVLDKAVEAQESYLAQKKQELKERQEKLTSRIKNKDLEKEPEVETIDELENEEKE